MGTKDVMEKTLESYNDVFSDIVNTLLFDGKRIVREDDLEDQNVRSYYKTHDKVHEMERDVAKKWKMGDIRVACIGMENQSKSDPDMPLRVIGYDGAAYREQLLKNQTGNRYPVVTLVLYFGKEKWKYSTSLVESLGVPEELKPYVNDYKINLFQIAHLSQDQIDKFQSDFKVVADYFKHMDDDGYRPSAEEFRHPGETLELLAAMSNDRRFIDERYDEFGREAKNMSSVLDRIELKGMEKGMEKGIAEERKRLNIMKIKIAENLYKSGISVKNIAKIMEIPENEINDLLQITH